MKTVITQRRAYKVLFFVILLIALFSVITTMKPTWIYKDSAASCFTNLFTIGFIYRMLMMLGFVYIDNVSKEICKRRMNSLTKNISEYKTERKNIDCERHWITAYLVLFILSSIAQCVQIHLLYYANHPITAFSMVMASITNAIMIAFVFITSVTTMYDCRKAMDMDVVYTNFVAGVIDEDGIKGAIDNVLEKGF